MSVEIVEVRCPHCGEIIEIEVELIPEPQNYIQDCGVCCRPIQFDAVLEEEGVQVNASRTN